MTLHFVFLELHDRYYCPKFPNTKCKIVKHQLEIIQTNPWQQNNHATLAKVKNQLNNNQNFFSKNPTKPINALETSNWGPLVKIMRKPKGFFSNVVDTKYDLLNLEKNSSVVCIFQETLRQHTPYAMMPTNSCPEVESKIIFSRYPLPSGLLDLLMDSVAC